MLINRIPFSELHPDLQSSARSIKYHCLARLIGAIAYPTLAAFGATHALLCTPVCLGIHQICISFAYRAAREIINAGNITTNHNLKNKTFTRFHFNYKGDLVLHNTRFSKYKGISLTTPNESPKINTILDRLFPPTSDISYFHLNDDIQKQADKILSARRLRFRACMGTALVPSIFDAIFDHVNDFSIPLPFFFLLGIIAQNANLPNFRTAKHTNDLWTLIQSKPTLTDIIKPQYKDQYPKLTKDLYLTLTFFGNIHYSSHYPLTLRQRHFYVIKDQVV